MSSGMKVLLYGHMGFIGSNINKYFKSILTIIEGKARCDDIKQLNDEIKLINPDRVICCIGKSYVKSIYDSNSVENNLDFNIRDNLFAKLNLIKCCDENNIHLTHIGDGSLYDETLEYIDEETEMNFRSTSHSIVRLYLEKYISTFRNILNIRLFNPISSDNDPRSFLMKIVSYKKIVNKDVSISILETILPIMLELISNSCSGNYNLCNNGSINLIDLKIKYKERFDSVINIDEYDIHEHNEEIGIRSHVVVSSNKLEIVNVNDALESLFRKLDLKCQEIKQCLCCRKQNKFLLDLGYQPLANDFHHKGFISEVYPLRLMYCDSCFHCQLSHAVNPEILFKNYKYVSGTSQTGLKFFSDNASFINSLFTQERDQEKELKVLDIACNDGSQLDYFKELGWKTYGVDPAENICPIAESKGHIIKCDFWNSISANSLPIMDVITAQNVFAHTQYIDEFLQDCKLIMDDNTRLFIQTSQRDMIKNGEFDTTYHEHISFYSSLSMLRLTERNDLYLNSVHHRDIHGGSYIFEISKLQKRGNVTQILNEEKDSGLYGISIYEKFRLGGMRSVNNVKRELMNFDSKYKRIGFGAAAKGQTFVCFGNIDLDYIIDESPLKVGTYSPKLDIPIVSLETFKDDTHDKFVILILAWNFADEIIRKINIVKGDKEVIIIKKYFPEIEFV